MDVGCISLVYVIAMLVMGCYTNTLPTARIVVHVTKRRAEFWEPWEVNRRICPPSLCKQSDSTGRQTKVYRPRGTAGTPFYQGDIVLKKDDERFIYPTSRRKRALMRIRKNLWKDAIIPYKMDPGISKAAEKVIMRAIQQIETKTCIKFKQRKPSDKDYIRYISEPGCWSNVGKRGGAQMVSIGRGCENVGTAVHETTHALGVWHEQARPDRDKYIKVEEANISPRYLPDFKILSKRIVTSRGYPYDYSSIMHYNKYAFTRMGEPTIKVIGIGKKLNLKIGQRRGLSTIDMAQLREMYHCNLKEDSKVTFCPKGWVKFQTSCYKFHDKPKSQFSAAFKMCEKDHARLVSIESKSEEKFLQKRINNKFPFVYIWRTGGRRVNNTMMWYKGDKVKAKKMKYTNWDKGMPATYTSMALVKDRTTKKFKWQGVWVGSHSQLPNYIYSFICEKRAKRKCVKGQHKDGRDYRGKLDHTIEGVTCQKWSEQYPHAHKLKPKTVGDREDSDGLGDHNYCRNPSGRRKNKPWCYTTKGNKEWQFCDITICSKRKNKNEVNPRQKPRQKPRQRPRQRPRQKPRPKPKPTQKPRINQRQRPGSRVNQRRQPTSRRQNTRGRIPPRPTSRIPNRGNIPTQRRRTNSRNNQGSNRRNTG